MLVSKQKFLNTYVNNISMTETISAIDDIITCKKKAFVVAINTDVIVKIENDNYLKKISDSADLTLVDGKPLIWISKLMNQPIKEKVSGSDLVIELLKLANNNKYSIFIIGGKDGIAEKAKKNILDKYPNIPYIDTYSPPFGFENDPSELSKINNLINKYNYDLLISCFGCPKQEKWVYENYKKYNSTVSVCAGATVDFLAGTVKRAPKWMSDCGLEWFYRVLQEPKRLFKRYFIDDLQIIPMFFKYFFYK